jgi:hypothetical protein
MRAGVTASPAPRIREARKKFVQMKGAVSDHSALKTSASSSVRPLPPIAR